MFAAGELVVYGGEGVCRVEGVGTPSLPGMDKTRLYYTLAPLYRSGQVMTPVDTRVLMRPLLTGQEVQELIGELDQLPEEQAESHNTRAIKDLYHQVVASYDCKRLAGLSPRAKGQPDGRALSQAGGGRPVRRAGGGAGSSPGGRPGLYPADLAQVAAVLDCSRRQSLFEQKICRLRAANSARLFVDRNHKAENRKPVLRLNGRKIDEKSFLSLASIGYPRDVTKVHA